MASPPSRGRRHQPEQRERSAASSGFRFLLLLLLFSSTNLSESIGCELTSFVHTALGLLPHPLRGLEEDLRATDFHAARAGLM